MVIAEKVDGRLNSKKSTKKRTPTLLLVAALMLLLPFVAAANLPAVQSFIAQQQESLSDSQMAALTEEGVRHLESSGQRVVQISTGTMHAAAIDGDGNLWTWGRNNVGQLGLGNTTNQSIPQKVTDGAPTWKSVSAGGCPRAVSSYTLAIGTDGSLWAWGRGEEGQLGIGNTRTHSYPQRVTGGASSWQTVAAGWTTTLAIGADGSLWSWGANYAGQLGIGRFEDRIYTTPQRVSGGPSGWQSLDAGRHHTLALGTDGSLWSWGGNDFGQLGLGLDMNTQAANTRTTPTRITTGASSWQFVATGINFSAAIGTDGSLWMWGIGDSGQLGQAQAIHRNSPTRVNVAEVSAWRFVTAGALNTMAIDVDGNAWAWGDGTHGQLGAGNTTGQILPQRVPGDFVWEAVSVSAAQAFALDADGALWSWGQNEFGQLGKGITTPLGAQGTGAQGTGTNNWVPWRVAASLTSSSASNWNPAGNATIPNNGAAGITELNTEFVTINFDRSMRTDLESRGTIVIDHGATVDVAAGTWSNSTRGPNTVFTAPLILFASNTMHTATVSGFVDAHFGLRGTNEMHPHTWTFTTARVIPPLSVVNVLPQGTNVAVDTEHVAISFNQTVNSVQLGTVTLNGQALSLSGATWSEDDTVLTIPLPALDSLEGNTLDYATLYTVVVADFRATQGSEMSEAHHQFVTVPKEIDTTITKTLRMPEGTTSPDADFIFEIVPYSFNEDTSTAAKELLPELDNQTISISAADIGISIDTTSTEATGTGSIIEVIRSSEFLLKDVSFPSQGIYTYRVSERADTFTSTATEIMTFDTRVWKLSFIVQDLPVLAGGTHVVAIHLQEVISEEEMGPKGEGTLNFVNTFIRAHPGTDPTDPLAMKGLTLSKEVVGEFANRSQYFDFRIRMNAPSLVQNHAGYRAYVVDEQTNTIVTASSNGLVAGTSSYGDYLLFAPSVEQTVSLRHNQTLVIMNVHVGAGYTITELASRNFTPSLLLTSNGLPVAVNNPQAGIDNVELSTGEQSVGEARNAAEFTNMHRAPTPAGLFLSRPSLVTVFVIVAAILVPLTLLRTQRLKTEIQNL